MQLEVGAILEGKVTGITNFGVFVELPGNLTGMVHISEVAPVYVNEIREHVTENQMVKVKVLTIGNDGKVSLSIKRALERTEKPRRSSSNFSPKPDDFDWHTKKQDSTSFEDMLNKFKQTSDDKFSDLKKKNADVRRPAVKRGGPTK
ncbi:MAG: RNA-binding protein S1 [Clostridiales bacterium 43-6]|nr:MAG: RNA-binding protein S1 [Clostridiales bacterium 43-6]